MTSPTLTTTGFDARRRVTPMDVVVTSLEKDYVLNWQKRRDARGKMVSERLRVLDGISFTVRAGDRIAVVGKSGAGKSTLMHLLGALDRPSRGSVTYGGQDVFKQSGSGLARFRNRNLGFIFQFHHLLPEFTALENVMMPAIIARKSREEAESLAHAVLREVGLEDRVEHKPGELSGGERQRVAVARAIVMRPSIILADEPTGNLDARTGGAIHDMLLKLSDDWGMTLIVVTHNAELARRMHRQIRLANAAVTEEAPGTAMVEAEADTGSREAESDAAPKQAEAGAAVVDAGAAAGTHEGPEASKGTRGP